MGNNNNNNYSSLEKPKRKVTIGKNGSLIITIKNEKFKKKRSHTDYIKEYMNRDLDSLDKHFLTFECNLSSEVTLYRCIQPVQFENNPDNFKDTKIQAENDFEIQTIPRK